MREDWEVRSFEKCVIKITPPKKVKSTEYHVNGLYPIISQDNHIISGYWDNINDIVNINKPVVIFGDHTRVVKYVDYNFVVGADGVIILQPIQELTSKYFYYYLKSSYIPNLGYSRHYKLLKNLEIPIPPLQTQHRIVEELDCLTSIIEKQKKQLEELDNLAQAIFYDMFGNPVENEKGWGLSKLNDIGDLKNGLNFSKKEKGHFIKVLGVSDFKLNKELKDFSNVQTIELSFNISDDYLLKNEDIVFIRSNGSKDLVGRCIIVFPNEEEITFSGFCIRFRKTNKNYNSLFLLYMFKDKSFKKYYINRSNGCNINNISQATLSLIPILSPPLSLQQLFASKIEAIEKQKELIKKSIKETEDLFNSRMDYYFN